MKLSHFQFNLPKELLAEYPAENRDESRLMVINREKKTIEHKMFKDIIDYFDDGDVMILNNTKVFPARLYGNKEKTGARIEVFLLRELNAEQRLWDVLVDPARKIRIGNKLYFGDDDLLVAEVIDNTTSRGRTLRFLFDGPYDEFRKKLTELGETPIPKYINRDGKHHIPLNRMNVFRRDGWACVYCGDRDKRSLTIDHVVPQSKGGKNTWENLVTACKTCNHKKSDLMPKEFGVDIEQPRKPHYLMLMKQLNYIYPKWKPYLLF